MYCWTVTGRLTSGREITKTVDVTKQFNANPAIPDYVLAASEFLHEYANETREFFPGNIVSLVRL